MHIEEFMRDFYRDGDVVTVDAVKLQELLREYFAMKRENKSLRDKIASLDAAIDVLKSREYKHVELDIKA